MEVHASILTYRYHIRQLWQVQKDRKKLKAQKCKKVI